MNAISKYLTLLLFTFSLTGLHAQNGFNFADENRSKTVIPFNLINNLIFINVNVNGVSLNFLLDSGVEETVLFSLDEDSEVNFFNVKKIKLYGLGNAESIDGLKSSGNVVSFKDFIDTNHDIYIVLDQDFNFSSNVGVPVNGILGYHFFKNHLVEIDYDRKKIIIRKENLQSSKRIAKKFQAFDISLEKNKPYSYANILIDSSWIPAKLLLDTGNSDAIWLFTQGPVSFPIPKINLTDYLGRGFSGDIFGKRARITSFKFGTYEFDKPLVAFPDAQSISKVAMVENRSGSVGGEILKRFSVIFDYKKNKFYLRKGRLYNAPFQYNRSGIEVQHNGMTWVKEKVILKTTSEKTVYQVAESSATDFNYKFELKPEFAISNIRKDSPGDFAGLMKGDVFITINSKPGYKYSLEEIATLFMSEEGKTIQLEIERDGKPLKFNFKLKNLL